MKHDAARLLASGTLALLCACDNDTTLHPVTFSGSVGVQDCSAWVYAATCNQLRLKSGTVTVNQGTFHSPVATIATPEHPGTISDLAVDGRYDTQVELGASPLLAIGVPPPACATADPVFAGIGAMVINFRITGNYKWIFGGGYRDANNTWQSNGLITESNLQIPVFNIVNAPGAVDGAAKELAKDRTKRAVDAQVSQHLNLVLALGSTPIAGLPVYAPGFNPHSASCR